MEPRKEVDSGVPSSYLASGKVKDFLKSSRMGYGSLGWRCSLELLGRLKWVVWAVAYLKFLRSAGFLQGSLHSVPKYEPRRRSADLFLIEHQK